LQINVNIDIKRYYFQKIYSKFKLISKIQYFENENILICGTNSLDKGLLLFIDQNGEIILESENEKSYFDCCFYLGIVAAVSEDKLYIWKTYGTQIDDKLEHKFHICRLNYKFSKIIKLKWVNEQLFLYGIHHDEEKNANRARLLQWDRTYFEEMEKKEEDSEKLIILPTKLDFAISYYDEKYPITGIDINDKYLVQGIKTNEYYLQFYDIEQKTCVASFTSSELPFQACISNIIIRKNQVFFVQDQKFLSWNMDFKYSVSSNFVLIDTIPIEKSTPLFIQQTKKGILMAYLSNGIICTRFLKDKGRNFKIQTNQIQFNEEKILSFHFNEKNFLIEKENGLMMELQNFIVDNNNRKQKK